MKRKLRRELLLKHAISLFELDLSGPALISDPAAPYTPRKTRRYTLGRLARRAPTKTTMFSGRPRLGKSRHTLANTLVNAKRYLRR